MGQVQRGWIPVKVTKSNEKVVTPLSATSSATLADTIFYASPDTFKAYTSRFGQGVTTGVFFTVPSNLYPIKIKRLIVKFYGGRTDTIGALNAAIIKALLWENVTTSQNINSIHLKTESPTQTISVPVEQIRQQDFSFEDTSEVQNPLNFAVGIRYTSSSDTIKAVSPVFGYPPNKYNDFYIDSVLSGTSDKPVYYDHQSYWSQPDSIGNMSAYLIVDVDTSGMATGITEERWHFPDSRKIISNYPNPFNPQTIITISSPYNGRGSIIIYNILGNKVYEKNTFLRRGEQFKFNWEPKSNATGIYFVALHIKNDRFFHKMIYLK